MRRTDSSDSPAVEQAVEQSAGLIPPAVTIVLDARDDYLTTRAALGRHDLAGGRVTVHPTPATRGLLNLAHDLMAALGKEPHSSWERRSLTEAWRQVTAWICGYQVTEVTVLRAHLLARTALARLAQLAADTGAALTLVWHTRPPTSWQQVLPTATLIVLDSIQESFASARAARPPRTWPAPQPMYCRSRIPQPGGERVAHALAHALPSLPISELPRFRADLYRQLNPDDFACADTLYAAGMDSACAFLTGHNKYDPDAADTDDDTGGHVGERGQAGAQSGAVTISADRCGTRLFPRAWADPAAIGSYLLSVVTASPSHDHSLALIRGAQAGFLLHGLLLAIPAEPGRGGGPGFSDIALTPQIADRIRASTAHPVHAAALAMLLATGLDADELVWVRRGDLSADASAVVLRHDRVYGQASTSVFPIPLFARDLMEAARAYGSLADLGPYEALLADGFGNRQWIVRDTAGRCGLDLPEPRLRPRRDLWHTVTGCSWVGQAIHSTLHHDPGKQRGLYLPQA